MRKVIVQYPIGTGTFSVASTANIAVNDTLTIGGNTCVVTAVDTVAKRVTCAATFVAAAPLGTAVTEPTTGDTFAINVIAIDADNVENGQEVVVRENGLLFGQNVTAYDDSTSNDGSCNGILGAGETNNYLCGVQFDIIKSGTLTVATTNMQPNENIIVSGSESVNIFEMRLTASDDDIEITDVYLENISGDNVSERLTFKLVDESGSVLDDAVMVNNKLHFEMSNSARIRVPRDSSITVAVRVDVKSITNMASTGKRVKLAVSTGLGGTTLVEQNGFEANTVATGRNLEPASLNSSRDTAVDEEFIIYKSVIKIASAANQPKLVDAVATPGVGTAIYRFVVTADAAGDAGLDKVSLTFGGTGVTLGAGNYNISRCPNNVAVEGTCNNNTITLNAPAVGPNPVFEFAQTEFIAKGTSVTYEIKTEGTITNDAGTELPGDSVTVTFAKDAAYVAPDTAARATALTNLAGENIVWSDYSNSSSYGASLNGYELEIPSSSTTGATR